MSVTAPYSAPPTNTLAVVSLVLGILGLNIVAVVLGHLAIGQIRRTGEGGRALAVAGLVLGYVGLSIVAVLIVYLLISGAVGVIAKG